MVCKLLQEISTVLAQLNENIVNVIVCFRKFVEFFELQIAKVMKSPRPVSGLHYHEVFFRLTFVFNLSKTKKIDLVCKNPILTLAFNET